MSLSHADYMENPTEQDCLKMLGETYTPEGVSIVWDSRNRSLGGERPRDLMDTVEHRRCVYNWALGLAEGVMG